MLICELFFTTKPLRLFSASLIGRGSLRLTFSKPSISCGLTKTVFAKKGFKRLSRFFGAHS
jgi:hypothetical protein